MVLAVVLIIISLGILYFGADILVKGGASLAVRLGVSPLVIGLTIVAAGTSAPELIVSIKSALIGASGIVVGNIVGSNIFNVCAILGLSAMIQPLQVNKQLIRFDMPIMIGASLLFAVFAMVGVVSRVAGVFLLIAIVVYFLFIIYRTRRGEEVHIDEPIKKSKSWVLDMLFIVGGLLLLAWGADILVDNGVFVAREVGWSEAVIGLTIVAIGTSLPELATSLVAAIKNRTDIAIGNVVGSNIFNLIAVLGASSVISPTETTQLSSLDISVLIGSSILLLPFMRTGYNINRTEGAMLLVIYLLYISYLLIK